MQADAMQQSSPTFQQKKTKPKGKIRAVKAIHWLPPVVLLAVLVGWELLVYLGEYPAFILPSPRLVAQRFIEVAASGILMRHFWVTLIEVLGGLALGISVATVLGYILAKMVAVERALSPYLVASQAIPIVAIAPLLIIWFGNGLFSKILISALIVFFPVLINTIAGIRGVSSNLYDLMHSLNATPWQIFRKLELPAALPTLLTGLKVGATLSVIGAVVGEFAGSDAGLGFMIIVADGQYDTAWVFVGVLALVFMALAIYGSVTLLERHVLKWQRAGE